MVAGKNNKTGSFRNRTPSLDNSSQQGYADFQYNQRFGKTASPRILGGRVNQTDVSNTNNIFIPISTPVNLEGDKHEQDLIKPLKTSLFRKVSLL